MRTIISAIIAGITLITSILLEHSAGIPAGLLMVIQMIAVAASAAAVIFLRKGVAAGPGPITKKAP